MQSHIDLGKDEAAALYAQSVERERVARQAMESFPPGSTEREQACLEWSEAIKRTNRAWRCLRDSSACGVGPQAASTQPDMHHAGT